MIKIPESEENNLWTRSYVITPPGILCAGPLNSECGPRRPGPRDVLGRTSVRNLANRICRT